MDDKKLLFIVNPRAGKTKSLAPLFDAAAIYSEAGYLVSVRKTTHRGEATELAESLGPEFDVVVCHGGDGTLNETVNGVMRIPREYRPLVSYLPGGSTNDFAASLNISSNPAEAAASAMRMKPRSLDVGKFGERNFVYVASFGAFTKTTYTVQQDIKNMFGHFAYLLEGVKNLDTLCPYRMKITADGEVFDGEYLFGAISNSTSIAGLMKLSPDEVSFDDGKFELLLVPVPRTPAAMQALILALINKDYYDSEGLIFRHVRHVTAETAEDIPWTLDGEYDPGFRDGSALIECREDCRVIFMRYDQITKRCENACACHSQVVTNLFQLLSKKSLHLSRRIEVLACRSIREKLLCFFEQLADEHGSRTFPLPFSLSMLADYISADRSAMMREMRKMREEDLISTEGRSVTLL